MRGADGGEVAKKERRYGRLWQPQCSVSGKTIRLQCRWARLAVTRGEGGSAGARRDAGEWGPCVGAGSERERKERRSWAGPSSELGGKVSWLGPSKQESLAIIEMSFGVQFKINLIYLNSNKSKHSKYNLMNI